MKKVKLPKTKAWILKNSKGFYWDYLFYKKCFKVWSKYYKDLKVEAVWIVPIRKEKKK